MYSEIFHVFFGDETVGEFRSRRVRVLEQELPPDVGAALKVQSRILDGWFKFCEGLFSTSAR